MGFFTVSRQPSPRQAVSPRHTVLTFHGFLDLYYLSVIAACDQGLGGMCSLLYCTGVEDDLGTKMTGMATLPHGLVPCLSLLGAMNYVDFLVKYWANARLTRAA